MKKKKIIITSIFLVLIAVTSFVFLTSAIESYNYDMDPANGVDILEGVGAGILIMIGSFVVFYELDLFYTVYYFFIRPKTVLKSIIVVLSHLMLILMFFSEKIEDFVKIHFHKIVEGPYEDAVILIGMFSIYFILKIAIFIIGLREKIRKDISDL
ncbi:MAG: hypothetical protein IKL21_06480 [Clostridia bacterium]|nr:hypothetical protein [Clostridia bacterium]